ncbi:MAG: 1-acyl-sn-glycerol-3-phosphate acyltransferase [Prevotellaceae bacterium]|jgi:hypothetical protein|nr:1-acyl-sn-glycerol-3-phosphate acyltransferase [Prevotellaceae bacterium]
MANQQFDDLRPYYDEEIAPAMHRIAESAAFPLISAFVYPDRGLEEVRRMIKSYTTVEEFQRCGMKVAGEQIIARSIRRFSCEGIGKLDKKTGYLFVSNHRDIMLDAALLQMALHYSGYRTTEITFGSNLMDSPLVVDIGRSNKMFKVIRGGSRRDFYASSLHLSGYIRHALTEKRESVWIAQRNGRTKDGVDATDPAVIKMFCMSSPDSPATSLAKLNIVPVSISYQWEPCDVLKAMEVYRRRRTGTYTKKNGEDISSILTGINRYKGDVHIAIGDALSEKDLAPLAGLPHSKLSKQVASLIDRQVNGSYRLTCNSYIAHDLRAQSSRHAARYTQAEKDEFVRQYASLLASDVEDKKALGDIFLGIYANPVDLKASAN